MSLEDSNYENDPRVRAAAGDWFESFDESRMVVTIRLWNEEEDAEDFEEIPAMYTVCPTCCGRGTHVNPSIDCNGLTSEDFAEDPDFADGYFSGAYDVTCYQCKGKRVVPEISVNLTKDQERTLDRWRKQHQQDLAYEALCRAERAMGA